MQRHVNGGQNVRAIDALAAITGNIGKSGGGAQYAQLQTWGFQYNAMVQKAPADTVKHGDRNININNFGEALLNCQEPPVKMLWVACRSPLTQDPDPETVKKAFDKMDLVVTVDMFMNPTVEMSDIVLPAAIQFESGGINVSYWHYWLSLNEPAIKPLYESKHDLQIAMGLSEKLNSLQPGSCTFPTSGEWDEWLAKEFNPAVYKQFGMKDWKELRKGPIKAKQGLIAWQDGKFKTPSGKYEFVSRTAKEQGNPELPVYVEEMQAPEKQINSQFTEPELTVQAPVVEINSRLAGKKAVKTGEYIKVYNKLGMIKCRVQISECVPDNVVVGYQQWSGGQDSVM